MKKYFLLSLVAVGLLAACIGTQGPPLESITYFLEYPPQGIDADRRLSCVLRVDAFDAPAFLATERIVYRQTAYQLDAYRYHRWSAMPADLVAWHLENDLEAAGICRAVIGSDSLLPATYVLEGSLDRFYEDDTGREWEAVLSVSLTLAAVGAGHDDRRILLQQRYESRKKCRQRHPRELAAAMSRAMADVSARAVKDVYAALAAAQ